MKKETKKRKDECQFCKSRFCYNRIYRYEIPRYDEVFCNKHIEEGQNKADEVLGKRGSKVLRTHQSSTGKLSRQEIIS